MVPMKTVKTYSLLLLDMFLFIPYNNLNKTNKEV